MYREVKLLHGLRGSNSQVNGHTDHGGASRPPPVAGKGRGASGSGRRGTQAIKRQGHSPGTATGGTMLCIATQIRNLPMQVATLPWSGKRKWLLQKQKPFFKEILRITSWTPGQQQPGQRSYRPWGSEPTAACGGKREGSEWQRSARDAGDKTPRTFAGYRNRGNNAVHCDSNPQPAYAGCHFTMVG